MLIKRKLAQEPGFIRSLFNFEITNLETNEIKKVLLDSYAIWEQLNPDNSDYYSPTRSTQGVVGLTRLKIGQVIKSSGSQYKRLEGIRIVKTTT